MWDFGILNLRNNKPSEQWTPISVEWPFGTMNPYFETMNLRNNEPSKQWTRISDKWPFGPINLRHNKPFFGTMNLRNNEPSEQWTFGTMNLRNNESSEKWTFGKADCNHRWGPLDFPKVLFYLLFCVAIWNMKGIIHTSQFASERSQPKQLSKWLSVLSLLFIYLLVRLSHLFMVAIYRKQRDIQSSAARS